jgi:hypothetical protein
MRLRLPTHAQPRKGASLAEAAIVIVIFLMLVFGMIDLALGVLRSHLISDAARLGARHAIVHGSLAPSGWDGGPWGPGTIDVPATASGIPIVDKIRPLLIGCDLDQTRILVEWLDADNDVEQRVRVTVQTPYQPMMTFIFGSPTITLVGSSTMPIAH